ncbi:Asp-tRNA(Asn)/Glu-tRNA(Gln) amidotransferase subunit GatA [Candidatus Uhrbacteria bacterium]|nr:Asp-tRNA(Asn)/Glu-tRNA(Gln) amidotransferase subunit GatA [Candidatus Uhrbacteria bacterium]
MEYCSIADAAAGLRAGTYSAEELTRTYLDRIAHRDPGIGAYLHHMTEDALASARRVDAMRARGEELAPLAGIPFAVKDVLLVAGHPATAASKILEPYVASYDATAVAKLKLQDAVLLGKTTCDEVAMGSSTENSAYHPTQNPWAPPTVPGGSSGGSAAAVAADCCVASLGTDTGGSVRQPASLCGVVGLKPTYGAVSRYGLIAMASSFDVVGPFTRTVADARLVFEAIAGHDPHDATSQAPAPLRRSGHAPEMVRGLRVGIPSEYFASGIDPDVEIAVREAMRVIEGLGCTVEEVSLPHTKYGLAVYYILMPSEVSANLARFDGMRYGASRARTEPHTPLAGVYTETRTQGFGPEVRRRLMLGTYALSKGYADRYYARALAVRALLKQDFVRAFEKVDVLLTPTAPTPAWPFGAKTDDPLQMYLSDVFTVSANVVGIPGMSVPCGFVERNGKRLPVGLQMLGRWFDESALFALGEAYQEATTWHQERPPLAS